jgi:hypothetical protein
LQITFQASKVTNAPAQSNHRLDKKTTTNRKERETPRENNTPLMHVLDTAQSKSAINEKREETTKEETTTRVLDSAQSNSAINVDDDDDKKADDPDSTPFDGNKVPVRNVEDGNDKVEDGSKSSLANTHHSKNVAASTGGFWSLSSSPIVRGTLDRHKTPR